MELIPPKAHTKKNRSSQAMVSAMTTDLGPWLKDEASAKLVMSVSSASQGPPLVTTAGLRFSIGKTLGRRDYRLIDCLQQPHPHLDGLYESVDEAMADAIGWLESMGPGAGETSIGLEVSTPCGSWRTIRQPDLLLCPLPPHRPSP
jgi:hypothetical protein